MGCFQGFLRLTVEVYNKGPTTVSGLIYSWDCETDNFFHAVRYTAAAVWFPRPNSNWATAWGAQHTMQHPLFRTDCYSTVTLLARLRGLSTAQPRLTATW